MGLHTPLHVCNLFLNPHDDTMFYGWCDFFFLSHIKNNAVYVSCRHAHTLRGASKWNRFTSVFTSSARYKNTVIIGLFCFYFFMSFLSCSLDLLTSSLLYYQPKNNNSTQSISLCATLETFCYWAARSYKPWWLHSMWENFLVNSPNGFLNALNH